MQKKQYKYIYGPVPSWRLGSSLGIDPVSMDEKICTFDCTYCQLWKTKNFCKKRSVFVPVKKIIDELKTLPDIEIDYITFSGVAEPTLAKNIGKMIKETKKMMNKKIAVLTNSTLLDRNDVQNDLLQADLVVAKLDAASQDVFEKINRPMDEFKLENIIQAIYDFRSIFNGKLALQIMFLEDNKHQAEEIAEIAKKIKPDEVQINTPLRPCEVEPLGEKEMKQISKCFKGMNVINVYEKEKKEVSSLSDEDTLRRRGKI